MRPLEFAGTGRWFGLVTRRTDAQNYYYVTFRSPNVISLRRMRDGVYTELASTSGIREFPDRAATTACASSPSATSTWCSSTAFRMLHVKDSTLSRGHPGVAGYRTRFDVDNVIVSGGTRVLLRLDSRLRAWSDGWLSATGTWEFGAMTALLTTCGRRTTRPMPAGYRRSPPVIR